MFKKILHNFGWLAFGQLTSRFSYFLAIGILARYVSLQEYAFITLLFLFTSLAIPLYNFGLDITGIRDIAQNKIGAQDYVNRIIFLKSGVSLLSIACMLSLAMFLGYFKTFPPSYTILYVSAVVLASFAEFFHIPFTATEKMKVTGVLTVIERSMISGFAILGLLITKDGYGFLFGQFIGSGLSIVIAAYYYNKQFKALRFEVSLTEIKSTVKSSFPIALNMLFAMSYGRIGAITLEKFHPDQVAFYTSAFFVVFSLHIAASTLMSAIFPMLSRNQVDARESLNKKLSSILKLMAPVLFLLTLGFITLTPSFVPLLFGSKLTNTSGVLAILFWVFPLNCFNILIANYLRSCNQQKIVAYITFLGVLVNLALHIPLTYYFGGRGLAIAYVGSEFTLTICFLAAMVSKHSFYSRRDVLLSMMGLSLFIGFYIASVCLNLNVFLNFIPVILIVFILKFSNYFSPSDLSLILKFAKK